MGGFDWTGASSFDRSLGRSRPVRPLPTDDQPTDTLHIPTINSTEEWVGGGATLQLLGEVQARRVVWRARGHSTWLAEFAVGRDLPRNGMQLPHGVLSRDALCIEAVGASGGDATAALLWTLSPNLVLRCVAYRRPHALPLSGSGRGAAAAEPPLLQGATAAGGATGGWGSLFDPLPRNEQAEALALRPATGSDYPSCCAFVVGGKGGQGRRHLVVGYPTGKVRQSVRDQ